MSKKTVPAKNGFTHLYGVRFNDEENATIRAQAKAKDVKPGTYIRMAAMESARIHARANGIPRPARYSHDETFD
jgi:hypothetical protein